MSLSMNHGGKGKDALREGAYIRWSPTRTGQKRLYEVVEVRKADAVVRDCVTEEEQVVQKFNIRTADLVREAPEKLPEDEAREEFFAEITAKVVVPDTIP